MPLPPPPPPPAAPQELTFYDQFLFRHSPTYNTWARLSAHDIHTRLCARRGFEGQDVWFFLNHPVRWVRVVGVVVACEELENRWCVTVDDGSAYTIDLLLWKNPSPRRTTTATTTTTTTAPKPPPPDLTPITIHTIIKAKGTLTEFRGTKQILLKRVHILPDTNAELRALAEVVEFRRVLGRPWVLPGKLVERERRKLHDSDGGKGGKGKRDKDKGEENAMAMAEKERGVQVPLQCSSFRGKRREAPVVTAKRAEEGGRKRRRESESEVEIEYPTDAAASTYRGRRRLHKRVAVAVEETIPIPPRRKEEGVEMPSTISTFAPSPSLPERVRQERVKMEYGLGLEVAGAVEDVLGSMAMSTFVPTPVLGGTFRGRRRTVDAFPLPLPSTSALLMEEEEIPVSTMSTFMPTPPLPSPSLPASFQRRRGVNIDTVEDVTETDMDMDIPSSMSSFAPTPTPAAKESYRGRRRAAGSNRVSSSAVSDMIEQTPTLPLLLRLRDSSPVDMPSSISTFAPTQESYRGRRRVRMESRRDTGQDLLATDMPSSISTFAPTQESYCGRRRVKMESRMDTGQDLLSPDMPSSISTFAPTPSLPVLQESYRGRRRGVDVPSSAATADMPPSSSSVGATYRAQYRAQKALRLEEAAGSQTDIPSTISTFVPTQPEVQQLEERSYLAQRRAAKAKALAEQAEALAKQAEEEYRASKAMAESALGSMSTFVPTQFEPPSPPPPVAAAAAAAAAATSSYRGRRRVAKAPQSEQSEEPTSSNNRIRYRSSKATDGPEVKTPAAFIPPTTTTTPILEAEDTYRGRRRRNRAPETPVEEEEPETELPSTMSTFVPTPTPTPMPYSSFATSYFSSYVVSQSQTLPSPSPPPPPPPVPAAVYRGRRRTRPRPAVV